MGLSTQIYTSFTLYRTRACCCFPFLGYCTDISCRAAITLHNPYLDFSDSQSTSALRCLESARVILAAYYRLFETSLDFSRLHPFVTVSILEHHHLSRTDEGSDMLVSCSRSSDPIVQILYRNRGYIEGRHRLGRNQCASVRRTCPTILSTSYSFPIAPPCYRMVNVLPSEVSHVFSSILK